MLCATFLALALLPPPRLDSDGIPLPPEAVQRLGSARFLVNNFAGAAFSPDGTTVYTISEADKFDTRIPHTSPGLIAWEVPTGKKRWQAGVDGHLEQVVADPDGKSVWVIERVKRVVDEERDQIQRVRYSTADGKELARTPLVKRIQPPALHPSGLMADANQVTDRDGKSTELPNIRPVQGEGIAEVAWSPAADRLFLISGGWDGDNGLTALKVSKGEQLWSVAIDPFGGWCVAPDGKSVVVVTQRKKGKVFARRLDAKTGKELAAVEVPGVECFDDLRWPILNGHIHFPPDGKTLYLISKEGRTVAVDVASWKVVETKVKVAAYSVFSPDGRMTLAPSGRNVVLHDFATGKRLSPGEPGFERDDHNTQLRFSAQSDRLLRRGHWTERAETEWDITSGRQTRHVEKGYDSTDRGTLSADGQTKAVVEEEGDGWRVVVSKVNNPKAPTVVLKAGWGDRGRPYRWKSFTPDADHFIGYDSDHGLHIWDAKAGGNPVEVKLKRPKLGWSLDDGMRVSADGRRVAVVEWQDAGGRWVLNNANVEWRMGAYDVPSGKVVHRFDGNGWLEGFEWVNGRVVVVVNLSTENLAFAPKRPTVRKFGLLTLDPESKVMRTSSIEADVRSWAAAPFGDSIAVGSSDGLRLFEASTGKVRHTFREQTRPAEVLAFSPDGKLLASESVDGPVLVWDVRGDLTKPAKPDAAGWDAAWSALGEGGAEAAFRAVRLFALFPDDGTAELKARFAALNPPTVDAVAALVAQLEAPDFARRQQAEKELRDLGTAARPALERALVRDPSEELRTRAEKLLAVSVPADMLRAGRAVEALRLAGTDAARAVVAGWAKGPKGDPLTVAAGRK